LECVQKTAPPVLVFCENKADVDTIHEYVVAVYVVADTCFFGRYLLLKGIDVVSIHGGKSQEERNHAIRQFKALEADVCDEMRSKCLHQCIT
jgi:ATP-dependent RNA helicase DDX41